MTQSRIIAHFPKIDGTARYVVAGGALQAPAPYWCMDDAEEARADLWEHGYTGEIYRRIREGGTAFERIG